jgi:hypothetical protein
MRFARSSRAGNHRAFPARLLVAFVAAVAVAVPSSFAAAGKRQPKPAARASASASWASATDFPQAAFQPTRTISVASASAFRSAWNAIRPGDEIDVHGVAFSGEQVFAKQLSGWAEVHFDAGTTFTGASGPNLPAVWIHGVRNVRFYGGTITNPHGGSGVTIYDSSNFTWWGFVIHDTANTGLFVQGISAPNDHLDLKGEISHWGENLALDPHAEKGSGLHGANLADANDGVRNSRFALDLHDGATGAGVEAGGASSSDGFWNNTLDLRCRNLSFQAKTQAGGNCLQFWGRNVIGNSIDYLEADNLQGRPYDVNGMAGGQSLATDAIRYGSASSTNLDPSLARIEPGISPGVRWDPRNGPTSFASVSPTP